MKVTKTTTEVITTRIEPEADDGAYEVYRALGKSFGSRIKLLDGAIEVSTNPRTTSA